MSPATALPDLPSTAERWELRGPGLGRLDRGEGAVPRPGPGEVLLRVDACGICFSDIKILDLGGQHPRLAGRDLEREPVVMGHEAAMTVVALGDGASPSLRPGDRVIVQADVYFRGENLAFGYRLPGGYSQYQTVGEEILRGDEGCYLLPVAPGLGYSQAALCEPWACVEASYSLRPRTAPVPGGRLLEFDPGDPAQVAGLAGAEPGAGPMWDDILCLGLPSPGIAGRLAASLDRGGVLAIQDTSGRSCEAELDLGQIHYRGHWLTPAAGTPPRYEWPRSCDLRPGGVALFVGAGGPLGQMHLQRALSKPRPPGRIVVLQRGGPRYEALRDRFAMEAARRGVEWTMLDAKALGEDVYRVAMANTGGRGYDDVVTVANNLETVVEGFRLLGREGGLNLFAGVAVGSMGPVDLGRVTRDDVRIWGTSGSSVADLRRIIELVEADRLDTDAAVAAVGGMGAVPEGLAAVRDGRFLGKTVIYPHLPGLPLTTIADLADRHPGISARLGAGRLWNREAERELFRIYGPGAGGE